MKLTTDKDITTSTLPIAKLRIEKVTIATISGAIIKKNANHQNF